jgi:hypothetical protein
LVLRTARLLALRASEKNGCGCGSRTLRPNRRGATGFEERRAFAFIKRITSFEDILSQRIPISQRKLLLRFFHVSVYTPCEQVVDNKVAVLNGDLDTGPPPRDVRHNALWYSEPRWSALYWCRNSWMSSEETDSAEKPPLFGISQAASKMLEKVSLYNAPQAIFPEWVDHFGGVFNCSFLISWGFSAESKLCSDPGPTAQGIRRSGRF